MLEKDSLFMKIANWLTYWCYLVVGFAFFMKYPHMFGVFNANLTYFQPLADLFMYGLMLYAAIMLTNIVIRKFILKQTKEEVGKSVVVIIIAFCYIFSAYSIICILYFLLK